VNGVPVWRTGKPTGARPGTVLKPSASPMIANAACGCGGDHKVS
jgi:N-acyl-D-amino-acid deacylase